MANEEHLKIIKQGVEVWNEWRRANPLLNPELVRANLRMANLSEANLIEAKLNGADLSGAKLVGARLDKSDFSSSIMTVEVHPTGFPAVIITPSASLSGADLNSCSLIAANLRHANLSNARLRRADFSWAELGGAKLIGADLTEAHMSNTTIADIDLSTVTGLETIKHDGPSTIGIDTIYRSKGKIPAEFLRGAGVPDNFIEYMSSLVGAAFEFYSCFISYSGKDQEFADRLYADLQREGVRCWFAPHHVQAGKKLHEQIDVAIRLHERLLLILSPDSIHSEWVKTEIAKARKREIKESKRVLFPVRLNISLEELQEWECFDADRGKDSAREIREYYIPDFTLWKDHDQYQKEFKKLLRDLKKGDVSAAGA